MKTYPSKRERNKLWVFRKIRPKDMIFSPGIFNIFQLSQKKEKRKNLYSFNLKFTRFSIYFKISQKKKKHIGKKTHFISIVSNYKNLRHQNKKKENKIFSIYKKNYLVRIKLKNFFIDKTLFSKKLQKKPDIQKLSQANFNINHSFKRNFIFFRRKKNISKLNVLKKKFDKFLVYDVKVKEVLYVLSGIFNFDLTKKYKFLSKYLRIFWEKKIYHRIKKILTFSNYVEIFTTNNFFGKNCRIEKITLNSKDLKLKINIIRKMKMKFFCQISKLLSFILPTEITFFSFFLTYSSKNIWSLKFINLNFNKYFKKKEMFKKIPIFWNFSFMCSEKNFPFLKESNLIINFISHSLIPKFNFEIIPDKSVKKTIFCALKHETLELIKSLNFFRVERALVFSEKFFRIKKESWLNRSITLFWYIFLDYRPFFLISSTIKKQEVQKINFKPFKTVLNSKQKDIQPKVVAITANLNEKKGRKVLNKEKNFCIKKKLKKTQFNQRLIKFFNKNDHLSRIHNYLSGYFKQKIYFFSKSKFRGFLSLKKIKKIKKLSTFVKADKKIKINKNDLLVLKNPKPIFSKSFKLFENLNELIISKNQDLNLEIIDKTGFMILKKETPRIFFTSLDKTVKLCVRGKNKIRSKNKTDLQKSKTKIFSFDYNYFKKDQILLKCYDFNSLQLFLNQTLKENFRNLETLSNKINFKIVNGNKKINFFKEKKKDFFDIVIFNKLVKNFYLNRSKYYFQIIRFLYTNHLIYLLYKIKFFK
jgi:hypothetical protein